jgi:D-glycero-alpha-D-manno-heptose-7-phosphate kinase
MIVRSKVPLRLGLAGGGTDVSPYSDQFGGCVLNATINLFAYCTLETLDEPVIEFVAKDLQQSVRLELTSSLSLEGELKLHRAIYNRIVKQFRRYQPIPVRITTYSDAPAGSGLGSSSTMVVAILMAFQELLKLPLGEYDIAKLAFDIERKDCNLSGGKQDQYAATFGGFNFMEFYAEDRVIINPLRIRSSIVNELHARLLLYFTGVSRESAKIIDEQIKAVEASQKHTEVSDQKSSMDAMHQLKALAFSMKEKLLRADIDGVSDLFKESWLAKKSLSHAVSNSVIDRAADMAMQAGAQGVKVSGAGGGGFMMIFVDPTQRLDVQRALQAQPEGYFVRFNFEPEGARAWTVQFSPTFH